MIHSHRVRNKWFLVVSLLVFPGVYFIPNLPIQVSLVSLLGGIYGWAFGAFFAKSMPEISLKRFYLGFFIFGLLWNFLIQNPMGFHLFETVWVLMPIGPLMLAYVGGGIAEKICSNGGFYI